MLLPDFYEAGNLTYIQKKDITMVSPGDILILIRLYKVHCTICKSTLVLYIIAKLSFLVGDFRNLEEFSRHYDPQNNLFCKLKKSCQ